MPIASSQLMGLRSKNCESVQANPHKHAFLPPGLKPNNLIWFAMHIFHFSLPLALEGKHRLCLDFLICITKATSVVKHQHDYSRDVSLCLKTECRVLRDSANGDRVLCLTKMKEHVSIFRSTAFWALVFVCDWILADFKDKTR